VEKYIDSLAKSVLFENIDKEQIIRLVGMVPYSTVDYIKGDIISLEGDSCKELGIILEGNVEIHKPFPSGKVVTINHFTAGNVFGESLIFSHESRCPANVVASTGCKIMYIEKSYIIKIMEANGTALNNFVTLLSNRILMLNERITNLSYDTIRKKIANIILIEYSKQKNKYLTLPFCRKKMAELLNIPRPSLSRELTKMKEDGIIDYHKNKLKIKDMKLLEKCLLE